MMRTLAWPVAIREAEKVRLIDSIQHHDGRTFFMQNYWAEMSVKRTRTSPRRETEEYRQWQGYGSDEAKRRRFDDGNWVVPWVSEEHALRTATEMFDHFSRLFQRTLRQLNSHRLAKLKAKKLQAEIRWLNRRARQSRG